MIEPDVLARLDSRSGVAFCTLGRVSLLPQIEHKRWDVAVPEQLLTNVLGASNSSPRHHIRDRSMNEARGDRERECVQESISQNEKGDEREHAGSEEQLVWAFCREDM